VIACVLGHLLIYPRYLAITLLVPCVCHAV
jgi:hypothetical protein